MKVVAGAGLVVIAVIAIIYWSGGFSNKSPQEIADEFKKVAIPGASWEKVADFMPPKEFQALSAKTLSSTSLTPGMSAPFAFKRDEFAAGFARGDYREGFIFRYNFSNDEAWAAEFDGKGKV